MATWTNIPDSSIEPGKPIRSIDGIALRDNPIAIAEGASGAPRINPIGAMQHQGAAGAVGTYAWAGTVNDDSRVAFGATLAGSLLRAQGAIMFIGPSNAGASGAETALTGTWRCMGTKPSREGQNSNANIRNMTLWLRIS